MAPASVWWGEEARLGVMAAAFRRLVGPDQQERDERREQHAQHLRCGTQIKLGLGGSREGCRVRRACLERGYEALRWVWGLSCSLKLSPG